MRSLSEAFKKIDEFTESIEKAICEGELSTQKYPFSTITNCYLLREPSFMNDLIPFFAKIKESPDFCKEFCAEHIKKLHSDIRELEKEIEKINGYELEQETQINSEIITASTAEIREKLEKIRNELTKSTELFRRGYQDKIATIQQQIAATTSINVPISFSLNNCNPVDLLRETKSQVFDFSTEEQETYTLIKLCDEMREHKQNDVRFKNEKQKIIDEYSALNINLTSQDAQLDKYGLLTLTKKHTIMNLKETRTLDDTTIRKYLWTQIPRTLMTCIQNCLSDGLINSISFKIHAVTEDLPSYEDMEMGIPFTLDVLSLPPISKFYDRSEYENNLWVKHDCKAKSLTFEELESDFSHTDDSIVTQVIHLEYETIDNVICITHLDHEYIFYSLEEFEKRMTDSNIKGANRTRIKTFKIDNSKIPLKYKHENINILLLCLDSFFNHKKLIEEYFAAIK